VQEGTLSGNQRNLREKALQDKISFAVLSKKLPTACHAGGDKCYRMKNKWSISGDWQQSLFWFSE
jgi:hypothetical protein